MNHAEVEELLGAYALDALPAGEAEAVRAHLATCEEHAVKARELRHIAMRLHETSEPIAAPAGLRSRLLDAVAREPQSGATAPVPPLTAIPGERIRREAIPSNVRRFPTLAFGAVAAAFIAVIGGLLAWNVTLQNRLDDRLDVSRATAIAPLAGSAQGARGSVLYFAAQKKAVVVGDNMPVLDPGKTYQLWAIGGDGAPKSIGLMQPDANGHTNTVVDFDGDAADTLAITIEPAGGSPQPTSNPVLSAKV